MSITDNGELDDIQQLTTELSDMHNVTSVDNSITYDNRDIQYIEYTIKVKSDVDTLGIITLLQDMLPNTDVWIIDDSVQNEISIGVGGLNPDPYEYEVI